MTMLEVPADSFKLELMKLTGFYYMFDPNVKTIFNLNVYRLLFYVITVMTIGLLVLGTLGIFFWNEDTTNEVNTFLLICIYMQCYTSIWKLIVFLYNANTIWEVFDITKLNFITNKRSDGHLSIVYECINKIKTMIIVYFVVMGVIVFQWIIFPLVINMFATIESVNHYKLNVFNIKFPVSRQTYNQFYIFFYISETTIILLASYSIAVTDIFIMTVSYMVIAQYEVLMRTFENIGHEDKPQKEHYEDLKSVLYDQQQIDMKLKSFYSVVRSIILLHVGNCSSCITLLAYLLIVETKSTTDTFKLGSTGILCCLCLFFYSFFFGNINQKREMLNFAIYSCNWTMMDLKFKKTVLLAMRMNDANQLTMKVSPDKIVDLQLFAGVMKTCYNIASVMIKHKQQK